MVDPVALLTLGSYTTGNIGDYDQTILVAVKPINQLMWWDGIVFFLMGRLEQAIELSKNWA